MAKKVSLDLGLDKALEKRSNQEMVREILFGKGGEDIIAQKLEAFLAASTKDYNLDGFKSELDLLFNEHNLLNILHQSYIEDPILPEKKMRPGRLHRVFSASIRQGLYNATKFFANSDMRDEDTERILPTHLAAYEDKPKILEVLLEAGANPDVPDCFGFKAIYYALEKGSQPIVNLLLTNGTNLDDPVGDGLPTARQLIATREANAVRDKVIPSVTVAASQAVVDAIAIGAAITASDLSSPSSTPRSVPVHSSPERG